MPRPVETALWLVGAILAIACYFLSVFYGWASVLVWTVIAFPLMVRRRTGARSLATRSWRPR